MTINGIPVDPSDLVDVVIRMQVRTAAALRIFKSLDYHDLIHRSLRINGPTATGESCDDIRIL